MASSPLHRVGPSVFLPHYKASDPEDSSWIKKASGAPTITPIFQPLGKRKGQRGNGGEAGCLLRKRLGSFRPPPVCIPWGKLSCVATPRCKGGWEVESLFQETTNPPEVQGFCFCRMVTLRSKQQSLPHPQTSRGPGST